ncbi:MAG: MGMT family protein [Peptococcaceae bacterium]|nr:MGMT family protein [Peptococcaceae bacterium]
MQVYGIFPSVKGWVGTAFTENGIFRLVLPQPDYLEVREELLASIGTGWQELEEQPYHTDIQKFLAGQCAELCLPVDWAWASPFQKEVLQAVQQIPYGQAETYGSLAAKLGKPEAVRAVGGALGRNRVPLVIPCHRVLAAGNKLGGFSSRHGLQDKVSLLDLEGIAYIL